ncbi:hypothetical protein OOT46_18345 [Aquabacterium sp. A7-Y]|uniref:hypothetical protein n=1 Tax=Aquabacterium sp. A7-Y TaxID=1349605 RepID=UPI00223D0D16|nr:hypothetical protein [Aquabacterium sp. A7-Y]MCW7539798.1 hypothetical protein [Aquabacterium sp. A7-Y]
MEALFVAGMLTALTVVVTVHWKERRAVSWGALGLCLLVPEASAPLPNALLLHLILMITVIAVLGQLVHDTRRLREGAPATAADAQSGGFDDFARPVRGGDMVGLLGGPAVRPDGRDAASL